MSESFYFRHDSIKNPGYDKCLQKLEDEEPFKKAAATYYYKEGDIEFKILEKIKFQWKTLRKAFGDLNVEKTGSISKNELKFYLHFWGIDISDEDFKRVYNNFDVDKDGKISYKDFYLSIGQELFPQEGLYFRQDKQNVAKIKSCNHEMCFQATKNNQNFCEIH